MTSRAKTMTKTCFDSTWHLYRKLLSLLRFLPTSVMNKTSFPVSHRFQG
jgi:hypothetical protein